MERSAIRARIPLPDPAKLDDEGRRVYEAILASRGNLDGPFLAWLHSPSMADAAQRLGEFCRYRTSLTPVETELAILTVAAHMRCAGEWQIHAPIAARAGLAAETIEALRLGIEPAFGDARLSALHALARALLTANRVDDGCFEAAMAQFGTVGVVEAVGVVGYYSFVAHTLNAFAMSLDDRAETFA